jgi:hypothetical protein
MIAGLMLNMPLIAAAATFGSTGLGGMAALRFRDHRHLLLGFSSGTVIGVALFDLLPEVFAMGGGPSRMALAAIGFLTFFGLERYTAMRAPGMSRPASKTATGNWEYCWPPACAFTACSMVWR